MPSRSLLSQVTAGARTLIATLLVTTFSSALQSQPPAVSVAVADLSDNSITLAWPGSASGYVVEQADSLGSANAWTRPAVTAQQVNGQFEAVLPRTGHARFYRLYFNSVAGTPTLDSVPDQTVPVGTTAVVKLQARDANQLPLTFAITPLPLPAGSRFDGVNGVLTFKPASAQVGTNEYTITVSNGFNAASEKIRLIVPAYSLAGHTALAGRLLDTGSAVNGAEIPLVGVVVSLKGFGASATTGDDGSFLLTEIPEGKQVVDFDVSGANPGPDGSAYAGFREEMILLGGVTNILNRPIYLPRLDASSLTTVSPTKTTVVTNANLGVSLTVPPNTAKTMDGFDFTDQMSISLVPKALAPVSLPEDLQPGLLVTIQPVGVQFSNPVPITFPNTDHLPPGMETDIWSVDPTQGVFMIVGQGRVTADGKSIETISGGVRAADWHMTLPPAPNVDPNPPEKDNDNTTKETKCEGGSQITLYSGVTSTFVNTPAYVSRNTPRAVSFVYNSQRAWPEFVVPFDVAPQSGGAPVISYELNVAGFTPGAPTFVDPATLTAGDGSFRGAATFDGSGLTTGLYPYQLRITSHYAISSISTRRQDAFSVVAGTESPFGVGWGIAGLQRLYPQPDGRVLLVDGDGSSMAFRNPTNSYNTPTGQWVKNSAIPLQFFQPFLATGAATLDDGIHVLLNSRTHFLYNPANDSWQSLPSPGSPPQFVSLTAGGLGTANGKLYLVETYVTNHYTWEYDPGTRVWRNLQPLPRSGTVRAVAGVGGKIYVIFTQVSLDGGGEAAIESILMQFDPAANVWTDLGPTPIQFNSEFLSTAVIGPRIYVVGDHFTFVPLPVRVYDTVTHSWSDAPSPPQDLHLSGVTSLAGKLYLCGGGATDGGATASKSIQIFDPQTDSWSNGPDMPTARFNCAAASADRSLFVFGGINGADLNTWHASEQLTLPNVDTSNLLYADGDFVPLTRLGAGGYSRTFPDGTVYAYDADGLLDKITDGNGLTMTFAYDAQKRVTAITDPAGLVTGFAYGGALLQSVTDPAGRKTTLSHDGTGNLTRCELPNGAAYSFAYDSHHLLTAETRPASGTTTHEYNPVGRVTKVTRANGGIRTFTPAQLVGLVDPNGGSGRQAHPASAISAANITSQTVDAAGRSRNIRTGRFGEACEIKDASGRSLLINPDTNGLPQTVSFPSGEKRGTLLDALGNVTELTDVARGTSWKFSYVDKSSWVSDMIDPSGQKTSITRDGAGNPTQMKSPLGRTTTRVYDHGLVTQTTDPGGIATRFVYDNAGNVTKMTSGRGAVAHSTAFTYTPEGYIQTLTDSLGRTTAFSYDAAGRVSKVVRADGSVLAYGRDSAGRVTDFTGPTQATAHFTYDTAGRMISLTPPVVAGGDGTLTWTYDAEDVVRSGTLPLAGGTDKMSIDVDGNGRTTAVSFTDGSSVSYKINETTGAITSLSNWQGISTDFSYDGARLTQAAWRGSITGTVGFGYDALGRVESTTVNGVAISSVRDQDGLVIKAGDFVLNRDSSSGNLVSSTLDQMKETWAYDELNAVQSYTASLAGAALYSFALDRDAGGRITRKAEVLTGATNIYEYAYDGMSRVTEVKLNGSTQSTYTYDLNGNRLTGPVVAVASSYDAQDRLLQSGTTSYAYDGQGRTISRTTSAGSTTYSYDGWGNLIAATDASGRKIEYLMDAQNRRVGKKVNGTLVKGWIYQGLIQPAAEVDGSGNVAARFVYGTRQNVPEYILRGTAHLRLVCDQLGSVRAVVDAASGNILQTIEYDAFGRVTKDSNPGFQPFGFAGGLYDPETGLVHFGAREYDPAIGRWTTRDPILYRGGQANLYAYVDSDPVNQIDPLGLWSFEFSFYSGIGGGVGLTYTPEGGLSGSFEIGVGKGGSFKFDPQAKPFQGDPWTDAKLTAFAEGQVQEGPLRVSVRAESNESQSCPGEMGPIEGKSKACVGVVCMDDSGKFNLRGPWSPDKGLDVDKFFDSLTGAEEGAATQGKAGVKVQFPIFNGSSSTDVSPVTPIPH